MFKWFTGLFTKSLRIDLAEARKRNDGLSRAFDHLKMEHVETKQRLAEVTHIRRLEATKVERAEEWEMISNDLVVENQNKVYQVRSLSQKVLRLSNELKFAQDALLKNDPILKEKAATEGVKSLRGFTKEEIMFMLKTCHPDKHGNSEIATDIAQKLIMIKD